MPRVRMGQPGVGIGRMTKWDSGAVQGEPQPFAVGRHSTKPGAEEVFLRDGERAGFGACCRLGDGPALAQPELVNLTMGQYDGLRFKNVRRKGNVRTMRCCRFSESAS